MGRVEGKVALITGAAQGQGRSHAIRLAEEGADIIAVDICEQIETAQHTMGTDEDLQETIAQVEKLDRRAVAVKADIRDLAVLSAGVTEAVAELGRLDIVSANAGIQSPAFLMDMPEQQWQDVIDVNLTGAYHTARATIPHIIAGGRGGSITFTSSALGVTAAQTVGHYTASKHGVLGLMKTLALELGQHSIRSNAILPTCVDTPMLINEPLLRLFMPHLEHPTRADAEHPDSAFVATNILPVPWVQPVDISNALVFLASDEARYVTSIALPVDAGFVLKK